MGNQLTSRKLSPYVIEVIIKKLYNEANYIKCLTTAFLDLIIATNLHTNQ